jgi:ribosome biogenesis protein UTP30
MEILKPAKKQQSTKEREKTPRRKEEKEEEVQDMAKKSKQIRKGDKEAQKSGGKSGKPEKKPKLLKEKEKQSKVFKKIENYSEFALAETRKYQKIRKNTIAKIPIDAKQVKQAVKALLAHYESTKSQKNLLDSNDDFIYIEIVMGKVPTEYSIRPIQM